MPQQISPICIFVDCTIPMSLLFQRELIFGKKTTHLLETLQKHFRVPCYISSSANEMTREKIKEISNKVGEFLTDFKNWLIHGKVIKYGRQYLTSSDVLDFQMFFIRKMRSISDERVKEEIRAVEIWIFDKAMILLKKSNGKINVGEFLKALFNFHDELFREKITEFDSYELRHKYWELKDIEPIPEIKEMIGKSVADPEDVAHFSSAVQYQFEKNVWIVFVSLDFRDLVGQRTNLFKVFLVTVCDPLYFGLEYSKIVSRCGTLRPISYVSKFRDKCVIPGSILDCLKAKKGCAN